MQDRRQIKWPKKRKLGSMYSAALQYTNISSDSEDKRDLAPSFASFQPRWLHPADGLGAPRLRGKPEDRLICDKPLRFEPFRQSPSSHAQKNSFRVLIAKSASSEGFDFPIAN